MFGVLHIDATFKLSEVGYPVITCGFSDRDRKYHLVGIFVLSRWTGHEYAWVFSSLTKLYRKRFGTKLTIDALVGDTDDVQHNGLQAVEEFRDAKFLMCCFHVLYNVRKRTRQLNDEAGALAYKGVVAMHYAASHSEFIDVHDTIIKQWKQNPVLKAFAEYFSKQWLDSPYWRWQAFHSPAGYATTNNPCETFNASVKRHVMRKMFDTTRLLRKLIVVAEDAIADKLVPITTLGGPTYELVKEAGAMVRARKLALYRTDELDVVRIVRLPSSASTLQEDVANRAFARLITAKTIGYDG